MRRLQGRRKIVVNSRYEHKVIPVYRLYAHNKLPKDLFTQIRSKNDLTSSTVVNVNFFRKSRFLQN